MNKKDKLNDEVNVTDIEDYRDKDKPRGETSFRQKHGDFADAAQATGDKAEWLVCEALSAFYLQRFRMVGRNILPSAVFFQLSWTHQALFYRLMKKFAESTRSGDDRTGVSQQEVARYMRMAQGKSHSHVNRIIAEALEAGFIGKATWNADERIKVLYLTPESVTDFMHQGLENAIDASMSNSLPELHLMLEKHRAEDDDYKNVGQVLRDFMDAKEKD